MQHQLSLPDAFNLGDAPTFRFVIDQLDGRRIAVQVPRSEVLKSGDTRVLPNEGMPIPPARNAPAGAPVRYGSLHITFGIKDFPVGDPQLEGLSPSKQAVMLRSKLWESRKDTTLLAAWEGRVADLLRILAKTKGGATEGSAGQLRDGWGRAALHLACESEVVEQRCGNEDEENTIGALIHHGANVDDRDVWACTPLHLACRNLYEQVVALLLEHGADIHTPNTHGVSPMDELNQAEEAAAAASAVVGDGSDAADWLRAQRVRHVVDCHLDRKLLQRMQVLAWVSGCVSYRLGRNSATRLSLPPALIQRISNLVSVAPSSGGGGGVVNLRNTVRLSYASDGFGAGSKWVWAQVGGGAVSNGVLQRFVQQQLALYAPPSALVALVVSL